LGRGGLGFFGVGIFDFGQAAEDVDVDFPLSGFLLSPFLGLDQQVGDVGKGGGSARRDTVGGEGVEEFAEDVVDVDLSDEIAGGAG